MYFESITSSDDTHKSEVDVMPTYIWLMSYIKRFFRNLLPLCIQFLNHHFVSHKCAKRYLMQYMLAKLERKRHPMSILHFEFHFGHWNSKSLVWIHHYVDLEMQRICHMRFFLLSKMTPRLYLLKYHCDTHLIDIWGNTKLIRLKNLAELK